MLRRNIFAALQYLALALALVRPALAALPSTCPTGPAVEVEGRRPLALLLGAGDGAADAEALARELSDRYGVPRRNVCLLTGAHAGRAKLEQAWSKALVARARPGDPVLVFLAAPGSQLPDDDQDEPDEWDETLIIAGERSSAELRDDEMQILLDRLAARTGPTGSIGLVVDASFEGCAAGARCLPPARTTRQPVEPAESVQGDGAPGWAIPAGLLVEVGPPEGGSAEPGGALTAALLAGDLSEPVRRLRPNLDQRLGARGTQIPTVRGSADALFPVAPRRAATAAMARPLVGRGWLALEGDGGPALPGQTSLALSIVPSPTGDGCARAPLVPAAAGHEQVLPLCQTWRAQVRNDASVPLRVAMVLVTGDGQAGPLPGAESVRLLQPGEIWVSGRTLRAVPPLGVRDHLLALGTPALDGPLPWEGAAAGAPWTQSVLALRTDDDPSLGRTRESSLAEFDVRPYLPANASSSLRAVLSQADALWRLSGGDGVGYRQHDWTQPNDAANLALGLDCSRAIWFAFTRAGVPYNHDDRYLWTGAMVGSASPMAEQFDDCSADPQLRTGDVLVYLDRARGEGHTVLVIDPAHRVAWGAHATDGAAAPTPDTGVEYQMIRYRADWASWDRPGMIRVACWRHRAFDDPPDMTRGADACDCE